MSGGSSFPQLDFATYPSQIFWLVVTFVLMYAIMSIIALPKVGKVIEKRRLKRQTDLGKAKEYNDQARYLKGDYESALDNARTNATKKVSETENDTKHILSERKTELVKEEMIKLHEAEASIAETRNEVLGHINEIAAELVKVMAKKLGGVEISLKEAKAAVDSIHKEG